VVSAVLFVVPGSLDTPTGGYAYDRRVIVELRRRSASVDVVDIGEGFPFPSAQRRADAGAALARLPAGVPVIVDGLALGVMPEAAAMLSARHRLVALVHHPLTLESGLAAAQAERLRASERAALAHAHHVIVTSTMTGRTLAIDFGVPSQNISVARPGCERVTPNAPRVRSPVHVLAVGSLVPRKGYDVLLAALATLRDLAWRLTITGERRDAATAAAVETQIGATGLSDRVRLVGAVSAEELARLYADADIFALASRFEGYGMAYAEAIAYGVPVVGTTGGAIPEVVPADAGMLVAPDDVVAFAAALRTLIGDVDRRAQLAAAARMAAVELPTWEAAADVFINVIGVCA
jgi:glycosyltransferase involved in cell wall biosynthesis